MKMRKNHFLLLFTLILFNFINAQPGTLDYSFGTNGIVKTCIGGCSYASTMALQTDCKIVVAGSSNDSFAVVRYNIDGSLDTTFGLNGIVETKIGNNRNDANSVAIQTDGKIVVSGTIYGSNYNFETVRYNTDGSLDTAFGSNGIVTTDVGSNYEWVSAIVLQTDGKILVAGTSGTSYNKFAIVRYNTDGSLDNTFGSNGIITTNVGSSNVGAGDIKVQQDGKIIVTGTADSKFATVRYNTDGSLDNAFGANGIVKTLIGSSSGAGPIAIQTDGKIIVAGSSYDYIEYFAMARYNTDGSLDTAFGTNGIVASLPYIGGGASDIALQTDGKIVGTGTIRTYLELFVVRCNVDGSLDNTFGSGGVSTLTVENSGYASSIAVQSDGKIIVAGFSGYPDNSFEVVRYNGTNAGISEISNNNCISVFPNPASDKIFVDIKKINISENLEISIYSIDGRLLLQQKAKKPNNEIDIHHFSKGIYFLKLNNEKYSEVKSFVKF
ncbi:MAG: T9SS type A sorting domain-containing protein [Bacteroidales bacterium]|nr:T9SS type A sorting domain-containing protein [Bacteroidales bacterium]